MTSEPVVLVPPGAGGVRDYAEVMNRHIPARILAPDRDTPLADYGSGDLVLNFSGYGYHPRGIPRWLVERLTQVRASGRQVGIYFHELFATEPPWRSAFWLGPTQRRIAADLGNLASYWLTSCNGAAQWLRDNCAPAPHRVLPVYSNVGELAALPATERADKIVVFGGPAIRSQMYRRLGPAFWRWVMEGGLAVHDIGPPICTADYDRLRDTQRIHAHGSLPAEQVSQRLAQARFGLLCYPPRVAAKSGVFAAYSAHGVCPILLADDYQVHDGLVPDRHYAAGYAGFQERRLDAAAIGKAVFDWYQPHRVDAHAQAFRDLMRATT
ncbi:MAG: hypothetical protein JSS56_19565 [Proteobacteria bacterium]|nr:hypothetical protein [Pseudomonadota bacterium]